MDPTTVVTRIRDALAARRGESFDLYRRYVNPGFADLLTLVGFGRRFVRASGVELFDEEGRGYLDLVSGYGVLSLGHNHPAVRAAIEEVLRSEVPGFSQVECSLLTGLAAERLAGLLPAPLDKVFFCSSGSEAVEAALKLARAATGRTEVVVVEGAFHGTTLGSLGLMTPGPRRDRFAPFLDGIHRVPFGDVDALERILRRRKVGAFIVEPVLGEGGAVLPPPGYLAEARRRCDAHGALLVVDEVQTGLGRTGDWFAFQTDNTAPHAVCLAKALGGGLVPVGALVVDDAIYNRAYGSMRTCFDHKTTFSGGPLAMAAVLATIDVIEGDDLVARARRLGAHLGDGLRALQRRHRSIEAVQGKGCLWGIKCADLTGGGLTKRLLGPLGDASAQLFAQHLALRLMQDHHIVTQVAANDLAVLKVMPPLVATEADMDRFLRALDTILSDDGHVAALLKLGKALVQGRLG